MLDAGNDSALVDRPDNLVEAATKELPRAPSRVDPSCHQSCRWRVNFQAQALFAVRRGQGGHAADDVWREANSWVLIVF